MSKLILATIMAAGVFSLSGCIENLEPAGISDLRGAKADLLRAQTALQAAQATKIEAEAALIQAQAKVEEAKIKQVEAEAAYQQALALQAQYEAEYQKLVNEAYAQEQEDEHQKRLAELERYLAETAQQVAQAEAEAQKAAAQLEVELLNIQTALLNAQAAYEVALKDLTVAKVALTPNQLAYIAYYWQNVSLCEFNVATLNDELEDAAEELSAAIATLDAQKADKQAIRVAQKNVVVAEKALEGAKEAADIIAEQMKLDPKVTDWAAQKEALVAQKDAMIKEKAEAYLAESAAVEEIEDMVEELTAAIDVYTQATGYTFNENTGEFSFMPVNAPSTIFYSPRVYVEAPVNEDGDKIFGADFYYENGIDFKYGKEDAAYALFDNRIDALDYLSETYYDAQIEMANTIISNIEESVKSELEQYDAAVAAYKAGDVASYFKAMDENYDVETPVAEYNAALADFLSALEELNELLAKSSADISEEEAAIYAEYDATVNAAYVAKVKARQDAVDILSVEDVKHQKADLAHQRAQRTYTSVVDAVYAATGYSTIAELEAAIAAYDALTEPTASETETYQKNKAALEKLTPAEDAWNAAEAAWAEAELAWTKANNVYSDAITKAEEVYNAAKVAAEQKRDDAIADLNVSASNPVDGNYESYVENKFYEAAAALYDKINNLDAYQCLENTSLSETEYPYGAGIYNVWAPNYLIDEETETLKTIEVADIQDAEYFLKTVVTNIANNLVNITVYARAIYYYNGTYYIEDDNFYYYYADITPLALPSVEEYSEWMADCKEQALKEIINRIHDKGYEVSYDIPNWVPSAGVYSSAYADKYDYQNEITRLEGKKAELALLPDFIAALEAAKAEFVAFVETTTAEIDAIRPYVEENWAKVVEEWFAMADAQEAYEAEIAAIDDMVTYLNEMIELYIGHNDVEVFIASLQYAYELSLEAIEEAEYDLEDAQDALAAVLAGDVAPVEAAQKRYDKIAAQLAEALKALEDAAAELEAALARIGESTAETPAETPAA